jgi:O-antigen ligase
LQPDSPTIGTLEVMLLSRTGKEQEAALQAKELLNNNATDPDLLRTAYFLGMRNRDPALAIQALEVRIRTIPSQAVDGWLKLGQIYASPEVLDEKRATTSFQAAINAAKPGHRKAILGMMPLIYRARMTPLLQPADS